MKGYYKVVRYSIVIFVHLLIYYSAEYSVFDEIPFRSITNPMVPTLTQQCWIFLHGFTDSETCHINHSKTRILSNDLRAVDQPRKKLLNLEKSWLTVSIDLVSNSFYRHMLFVTSRYTFFGFSIFHHGSLTKDVKKSPNIVHILILLYDFYNELVRPILVLLMVQF